MPRKLSRSPYLLILLFIILSLSSLLTACDTSDLDFFTQESQGTTAQSDTGESNDTIEDGEAILVEGEESIILIEEIIIILLFIATLVGIAARRFRVPYTLGLVVIGLLITLLPQVDITIQPTLIFALLIPPLVFEGAFHLNFHDLRRDLVVILTFARISTIYVVIWL
jgi:hypothetical protein